MRHILATPALAVAALPLAVQAPAPAPGDLADPADLAIRSVTVRPGAPVVGPSGSVRLVVDVSARGAARVSVEVEPGRPDGPEQPEQPGQPGQPGQPEEPEPSAVPPEEPAAPPFQEPFQQPFQEYGPRPAAPAPGAPAQIPPRPGGLAGLTPSQVPRFVGTTLGRGGAPWFLPMRTTRAGAGQEWETWRFLPEKALSRWYPSGPWTVTATAWDARGGVVTARTTFALRRATSLEGVKAVRDGDEGVRVTGTLLRVDPVGRVDYRPFPGQRVTVSYRRGGSGEWRPLGRAFTRRDGWFSTRLRAPGDGVWRAEYSGTTHYAPDVSAEKHL
ncbi:hypothetical protein [Microbispora sp. NPDC049125]|uniref:hypothetical protein n=1 Tax=Microbispora sp. NPDC049125 TaxID=3154929 RepID=UPI00346762FA